MAYAGVVYSRRVQGRTLSFGVSGLLYRANVLMYDHQTESLWSQVLRKAITGPLSGTRLEVIPSTVTRWDKWRQQHPGTEVLSFETGYSRDYSVDPYGDYYASKRGFSSLFGSGPSAVDKRLVVGITRGGLARAYPLDLLREVRRVIDRLDDRQIELNFDRQTGLLEVRDGTGQVIPHIVVYWFVWKGIYPATDLFQTSRE